jgi:hypothetical protein
MLEMSETVPLGPTGKVLKRDLRGRYRDVLTALPRVQVAGRAYSREMSQPVKGET